VFCLPLRDSRNRDDRQRTRNGIALVCSALSFAAAGRLVAVSLGRSSVETAAVVARWATLLMVPAGLAVDSPWHLDIPPAKALLATALLGVGSTVFYVAYYRLIATAGLAFASTHHFLIPVLALALDVLIDHRLLSATQLAYVAAILLGVALSGTRNRTTADRSDPADHDSIRSEKVAIQRSLAWRRRAGSKGREAGPSERTPPARRFFGLHLRRRLAPE
jgi:hypothetical protein